VIVQLRGEVVQVDWEEEQLVIDVRGVGYGVYAPRNTLERLGSVGQEVRVYTHLYVREDILTLYGFATQAERQLFQLLLGVSKVGPKLALAILSTFRTDDIRRAVQLEDATLLTEVPGIGKKTAQRLILELRDKLGALPTTDDMTLTAAAGNTLVKSTRAEAEEALLALGYSRRETLVAVERAAGELGSEATVEELVRASLQQLATHRGAD